MATELEVVDVEEYGRNGKPIPQAKSYRFRVDREIITVGQPVLTGRQILELAHKTPPEKFKLFQHLHGGQTVPVALTDIVDLRAKGIERFKTLPTDPMDGLQDMARREFLMPEGDVAFLDRQGLRWETLVMANVKWLFIYGYPIPKGYTVGAADIALRIDAQYPDAQIDMAYFKPALARTDGGTLHNLSEAAIGGQKWQQWSRHRTQQNPWRPGVDDVETHLLLVNHWLQNDLTR